MNQVWCRLDAALAKVQHAEEYACTLEIELNICPRWTESDEEYKEFYHQTVVTNYSKALDELERLIVMHFFELAKMSMSGIGKNIFHLRPVSNARHPGYKLRRQISKALQRRSEAIRKALDRYNTQAARLNPPRSTLSWEEIVDYTFIREFDLLRHSRDDIRSVSWAQPACREATLKFFKLCRAREELTRLNVEIRWLRTWIHDESSHTTAAIANLSTVNPLLAAELKRRSVFRTHVNQIHLQRLDAIGRAGLNQVVFNPTEPLTVSEATMESGLEQSVDVGDDIESQLTTFTDFMLGIKD